MAFFDRFKKQTPSPASEPAAQTGQTKLIDFHPYDTGLAPQVEWMAKQYRDNLPQRKPCGRDGFAALLAGVAALRKTPGIPGPKESGPNYFTSLPRCASPGDASACRAHLEQVFGITDKASLLDFCKHEFNCNNQYLDFVGAWEGHPSFPMEALNEGGRKFFTVARDFSAQFYPIVGHQGYLAWDISERVGHLRNGYACGLLSREEFDKLAEPLLAEAQAFDNWGDYAVSLVCGGLYWDFRHGSKMEELSKGLGLWMKLTAMLLDDENAWGSGLWYTPPQE